MDDVTHSYATCLIHVWDDTRTYTYICMYVYRYINSAGRSFHQVSSSLYTISLHPTSSYVTWSFICDMTHSYAKCLIHMRHASFICDMTIVHTYTYIYMYVYMYINSAGRSFHHVAGSLYTNSINPTSTYATRLIHTWQDSFIRDTTHSYAKCPIRTWHDNKVYIYTCIQVYKFCRYCIHTWTLCTYVYIIQHLDPAP